MSAKHLISFIFVSMCIGTVYSQTTNPNIKPSFNIFINPQQQHRPEIKPKTIVNNDIEAYYFQDTIFFTFNVDLGNAYIIVVNTTSNESWEGNISGIGTTSITLSDDEGSYHISIYTDDTEYVGFFTL